jgi:hypothetical protein
VNGQIVLLACANCGRQFGQAGRLEAFCAEECRRAAWVVRTLRDARAHHRGPQPGTLLPDPDKAKLFVGLSAAERMVRLDELHRRIHAKVPERACDGLDWDRQAWITRELADLDHPGPLPAAATTSRWCPEGTGARAPAPSGQGWDRGGNDVDHSFNQIF